MCFTSIFSDLFPILFFNDLNSIAKILRHSQLSGYKIQPFSYWFNMEHNFVPLNTGQFCNTQYTWVGNTRSKVTQDSHSKSEPYRCCVVHHFFSFTPSLMLSRTTTYIRVWCLPDATLMTAPMKPAAGWSYLCRICGYISHLEWNPTQEDIAYCPF